MNPFIAGAGLQALGGIFGGSSRKKAAREQQRLVIDLADDMIVSADQDRAYNAAAARDDQARAIAMRQDDEARLRAATGLNLKKLRDQAIGAGFNPLTVLQATGGAGYDGRGAVLTTPFIGTPTSNIADYFSQRAQLAAGTGQAIVENSGYFGDALSGIGDALIALDARQAQQRHETELLNAELTGRSQARMAAGGFTSSGGSMMGATALSAGPARRPSPNPFTSEKLQYGLYRNEFDTRKDPIPNTPFWQTANLGGGYEVTIPNQDLDMDIVNLPWIVFGVPPQIVRQTAERFAPGLKGIVPRAGKWVMETMKGNTSPAFPPGNGWTTGPNGMLVIQ